MNTDGQLNDVYLSIEQMIKNNQFNNKEELLEYINRVRTQEDSEKTLTDEKMMGLLNLYDELHPTTENALNIEQYKGVKLEDKNLIISKKDDVILKTNRPKEEITQEFKENQNELTSTGKDGLANADEVFNYMKDYKKEELKFMSLHEAIETENISEETLNKIRFFITNKYINPHEYMINLENEIFYNIETQESLEVRKNEQTGNYEIYKGGEVAYSNNPSDEVIEDDFEKEVDTNEEPMAYNNKNIKVRRLTKPENNNAAFISSTFIIIISLLLCIALAFILSKTLL